MSRVFRQAAAIFTPALIVLAGSCDKIWGLSPRTFDPNLVCEESGCRCAEGFDDCDGDQNNGCEADLQKTPESCGTCGARCDNGACNGGACQCKAGFDDCDGDRSNGCETSITDDPSSCGACGHDCLGTPCNDGRCAPTLLAKLHAPTSLVLAGGYLYVGSCDTPALQRIPIRGGTAESVYSAQGCVLALAVDQGSLYFAINGQILTMKLDGSSPPSLVVDAPGVSGVLAVIDGYVYWQQQSDLNYLHRFSSAKGLEAELWEDHFPWHAISLTPKGAYWAGSEDIEYLPHSTTVTMSVANVMIEPPKGVLAFTLGAAHAYWAEPLNGVIKAVPIGGGATSVLTSASQPTSLFVDTTSLYWTDAGSGAVRMVALGAPNAKSSPIATGQEIGDTSRITGDEEAVYWFTVSAAIPQDGDKTGKIWRATK